MTFGLLSDLLTGDSDLFQNNYYDYYKQYDNKENKQEGNENITFIEKEKIDKAAEGLSNLGEGAQTKVINKLRGRMHLLGNRVREHKGNI